MLDLRVYAIGQYLQYNPYVHERFRKEKFLESRTKFFKRQMLQSFVFLQ